MTGHEELDQQQSLEWLFRTVGRMHFERVRSEMSARGLGDVSHPRILFLLLHHADGKDWSQKELADQIGVKPATVANSLRRMEQKGLLRRLEDKGDRRRNRVELTDLGQRRVQDCIRAFHDINRTMFQGFSDRDREQLTGYFRMIRDNLKQWENQ